VKDPARILAEADPRLGALIERVGPLESRHTGDRFSALARAIVGRQLSIKAASTIWGRVATLLRDVRPETVMAATDDQMREAGLSRAKAVYLRDLSERVLDGRLDLGRLDALDDETVIDALTQVKGIGRWTAEMFLIFSLSRPDVLALDDLGIRRAAGWLLELGRNATVEELAEAGELWRPHRSTASLYLWEAIGLGIVR
jgi:DNA-3-methyladenine glycosylase II